MKYITDLHVHPSFKPFNRKDYEETNIWTFMPEDDVLINGLPSLIRDMIGPTKKHSQTNLNSLLRGKVRGIFCVLHPFERGWLVRKKGFLSGLANLFLRYDKRKNEIGSALSGMHIEKINKIFREEVEGGQSVDYYQDTFAEYQFLVKSTMEAGPSGSRFFIVTNFDEYKRIVDNQPETVAGILTVEGGHAFGKFPKWNTHLTEWKDLSDQEKVFISEGYFTNIDKLKGKNYTSGSDVFDPDHTPLFTTLVHMYNNYLAGHAKSYSGLSSSIFDQRTGMDGDITELGKEVIRRLLHRSKKERRILIDVKHLSAKSRQTYYDLLANEYKNEDVPIIFSHGAVTGCCMKDIIGKDQEKLQKDSMLSAMPINLCEEDIKTIVDSNGLIGLSPHEGRMPGGKAQKKKKKMIGYFAKNKLFKYYREVRRFYVKLFMANVFYIVHKGGKKAWDHITLGSDYDGIMDPFDIYRTGNEFSTLMGDILNFLEKPEDLDILPRPLSKEGVKILMHGYQPSEIVDKIAFGNTERFLERYFNEAYLKGQPTDRSRRARELEHH